jgi:hypothetical protein
MQRNSTQRSRPIAPVALAGTMLLGAVLVLGAAHRQDPVLRPDPRTWAEIRRAIHATDEPELRNALNALASIGGTDFQDLIPQLFLFSKDATDTQEAMAFGALVDQLRIPDVAIVRALVPLLESSDGELRREIGNVLSEFEQRSVDRPPSFAVYRGLLEERLRSGQDLPVGLLQYLYETDPGTALLLLMRIHAVDAVESRGILWAEHVVADNLWKQRYGFLGKDEVEPEALEQVRFLSKHPRWWARASAAAFMSRHPAFSRAEIEEALRQDEHQLVRRLVAKRAPPARER